MPPSVAWQQAVQLQVRKQGTRNTVAVAPLPQCEFALHIALPGHAWTYQNQSWRENQNPLSWEVHANKHEFIELSQKFKKKKTQPPRLVVRYAEWHYGTDAPLIQWVPYPTPRRCHIFVPAPVDCDLVAWGENMSFSVCWLILLIDYLQDTNRSGLYHVSHGTSAGRPFTKVLRRKAPTPWRNEMKWNEMKWKISKQEGEFIIR